eukprot:gnl/Spiro4/10086_TR5354_c0_g1_i1.p1 gnl/Spiro4/10086_TR5354_c0_g1~~gnl/Spiro4/10086_TR5354_c0_g1_i1.p1  ORF type:complete len:140 (-),score=7.18 gnl/Spiro4/10086_TR5354_c0_g1_i1:1232-1651(-)
MRQNHSETDGGCPAGCFGRNWLDSGCGYEIWNIARIGVADSEGAGEPTPDLRKGATMKHAILLLVMCTVGCGDMVPSPPGHNRAVYVRNPAHHCKLDSHESGHEEWDYFNDKPESSRSFDYYKCDNGMRLLVYDDEEQP